MGDYTNMSNYYDLIMTSGYYDYKKIVNDLISSANSHDVLEIGCGTGLIIEELASRKNDIEITGFDLTDAMLDIARQRLNKFEHVKLVHQNVTGLQLNKQFDLAYSYGGVWYFVMDGVNEPFLVSHIYDEKANVSGLSKVSEHVKQGGQLLLGVQGPHHNYQSPIKNGFIYSQTIEPLDHGFSKQYFLHDGAEQLMQQRIDYRTYPFTQAMELLGSFGFKYQASEQSIPQFQRFIKA